LIAVIAETELTPNPPLELTQLLIISHDIVGANMAGPGIRYYHLARVLGQEFAVKLAVPSSSTSLETANFTAFAYQSAADPVLKQAVRLAGAILVPAVWLASMPQLLESSVPVIVDGYDPCLAETLALQNGNPDGLQKNLAKAYMAGDFFICASERQRDWWLGLLEASGRINNWNFQADASLRSLVDVVPYGLPETLPQHTRPVIKGVWPGIAETDYLILWGGGLWPWLDPLTAIRAVERVWQKQPDIRLVFPGTRHPNPALGEMPTYTEAAIQLARKLGLLDKAIFFGDWIPYADWPSVLLESDLALTLHYDTMETRLAFRSRVLDYIWAALPVIATRGDATAEMVEKLGLGQVVNFGDVDGAAEAIFALIAMPRENFRQSFERARQILTWKQAAQPLIEFCRQPHLAPDKESQEQTRTQANLKSNELLSLRTENKRLVALLNGYEQGRFIRLTRWFHRIITQIKRK